MPHVYLQETVTIRNELGLHARPAAKLVHLTCKYPVEIFLQNDELRINAKSIMGVLMLAASKGTELTLEIEDDSDGTDPAMQTVAQSARDAVVSLIESRFGEER